MADILYVNRKSYQHNMYAKTLFIACENYTSDHEKGTILLGPDSLKETHDFHGDKPFKWVPQSLYDIQRV